MTKRRHRMHKVLYMNYFLDLWAFFENSAVKTISQNIKIKEIRWKN
jgi:hypothetical protein